MIRLRRERAVYRVYGEDEFLGGVDREDLSGPVASGMGERRLRRLAGAAMLAGAVGAVGGVITATNMSSGRGAVRKMRAGSRPTVGRSGAETDLRTRLSSAHGRVRSVRGSRRKERKLGTQRSVGAAPALRVAVAREDESASIARSVASAAAVPVRRERVEFGFER